MPIEMHYQSMAGNEVSGMSEGGLSGFLIPGHRPGNRLKEASPLVVKML